MKHKPLNVTADLFDALDELARAKGQTAREYASEILASHVQASRPIPAEEKKTAETHMEFNISRF